MLALAALLAAAALAGDFQPEHGLIPLLENGGARFTGPRLACGVADDRLVKALRKQAAAEEFNGMAVFTAADRGIARALRDCAGWSVYLPSRYAPAERCQALADLAGKIAAQVRRRDWEGWLDKTKNGMLYLKLTEDSPEAFILATNENATPERPRDCKNKPVEARLSRGDIAILDLLPEGTLKTAWQTAARECSAGYTEFEPATGFSFYAGDQPDSCFKVETTIVDHTCDLPRAQRYEIIMKACPKVENLQDANRLWNFLRTCKGEGDAQAEKEFQTYHLHDCLARTQGLSQIVRCQAAYRQRNSDTFREQMAGKSRDGYMTEVLSHYGLQNSCLKLDLP